MGITGLLSAMSTLLQKNVTNRASFRRICKLMTFCAICLKFRSGVSAYHYMALNCLEVNEPWSRSRLYRRRFVQEKNTRWKALDEIYKICTLVSGTLSFAIKHSLTTIMRKTEEAILKILRRTCADRAGFILNDCRQALNVCRLALNVKTLICFRFLVTAGARQRAL